MQLIKDGNIIYDGIHTKEQLTKEAFLKLELLEGLESVVGVDLYRFVFEMLFILNNCSHTVGYTTTGQAINTDYGYVEEFVEQLKEALC